MWFEFGPKLSSTCDAVINHGPLDLKLGASCECRGSVNVFSKFGQLRQGVPPFVASAQRPELIVWLELERETQLPNILVLCVLAHDKLPRQVEGKMLTRSPIVGAPLEKKHIRVLVLIEYASVWS